MFENFLRTAVAVPKIRIADCEYNALQIIDVVRRAADENVRLVCMPELCITAYTCGDLFLRSDLLANAKAALLQIVAQTADCDVIAVAGLPIIHCGKLFNVAAVFSGGKILGLVPKTYLPNYGGFDELRYFTPPFSEKQIVRWGNERINFGTNIIFKCREMPQFKLAVEIGDDLWGNSPPGARHAAANATIIANISADSEAAGRASVRRTTVAGQSERLACGYIYANAGQGESTTDSVFSGHSLICERGTVLAEAPPFGDGWAVSEIDLNAITHDRRRKNTFVSNEAATENEYYWYESFSLRETHAKNLIRRISPAPFIPDNPAEISARCEEILAIQAAGLKSRLEFLDSRAVIGVSGGLDSTLALLVIARAYENLNRPLADIIAVTMPCFGTSERTKSNAHGLCDTMGIPCREIDITETTAGHLRDISHPQESRDTTFENAQARVRTLVLMDLANQNGGIAIGTGNLSEIALGWATFNGDHMSMYSVNAGVPKTLVRHMVRHFAENTKNSDLQKILTYILDTPVSPELLPPKDGEISQQTEDILGPYELHDFFLYHFQRHGRSTEQVNALAQNAFADKYSADEINARLRLFCNRFTTQQFKRNCMPDAPKVGSVSLGRDWRMPSDIKSLGDSPQCFK